MALEARRGPRLGGAHSRGVVLRRRNEILVEGHRGRAEPAGRSRFAGDVECRSKARPLPLPARARRCWASNTAARDAACDAAHEWIRAGAAGG